MRNPLRPKNLQLRFAPLIAGALLAFALPEPRPHRRALAFALVFGGLALRAWAAGYLVKTRRLIAGGPYAHLRHPLYLGSLLCALGVAAAVRDPVGPLLGLAFALWFALDYFPRKERSEAGRLEAAYGAAYARYRGAVPALLPRSVAWLPPADEEAGPTRWSAARALDNNEHGVWLAAAALVGLVLLRWLALV